MVVFNRYISSNPGAMTLVVLKLHVQSWGSKPAVENQLQQEGGKARAPAFAETCGLADHKD
jgi:hypothetical protein